MTPAIDRVLRLQGASNFRDLGGYRGDGGRVVRWRRLFRSDHLGALTASDRAALAALGVTRAFDFRGRAERAATPYQLPGVTHHVLGIEPTVVQDLQALLVAGRGLSVPVVVGLMEDLYRALVNDQAHRFADLFEQLLQSDSPSVFHCTAGKDRTGVAAALLLLALGVPREQVVQDYLLTNEVYRHAPPPRGDIPADALAVLWRVQPGFLDAALRAIDGDHGGPAAYLERRLGMTAAARALLMARYLQAA